MEERMCARGWENGGKGIAKMVGGGGGKKKELEKRRTTRVRQRRRGRNGRKE